MNYYRVKLYGGFQVQKLELERVTAMFVIKANGCRESLHNIRREGWRPTEQEAMDDMHERLTRCVINARSSLDSAEKQIADFRSHFHGVALAALTPAASTGGAPTT